MRVKMNNKQQHKELNKCLEFISNNNFSENFTFSFLDDY